MKTKQIIIIILVLLLAAVGYKYIATQIQENKEKEIIQAQSSKEKEVLDTKKDEKLIEDAISIKEHCLEEGKQITSDFEAVNIQTSPIFYPYDDAVSFNKNERLSLAIKIFYNCINGDPRYKNGGYNESIEKIISDADWAYYSIRKYMAEVKNKNPQICESYLLSPAAKKTCQEIDIDNYESISL